MSRPWMPLYISDYLADTRRLTTLEHGAYLLLIMEYWQHGALSAVDEELAEIAGLSIKQWAAIKPRMARLFLDGWRHKRIDEELAKAEEISANRKASAERRWSKSNASASDLHETSNARARVPQSQPQPQSQDTSLRSVAPAKRRDDDPKAILETILSPEIAAGVVEHRRKLRKPLTTLAAQGLAKAFADTGQPEAAARMMVERGWQGFRADWFARDAADRPEARAGPAAPPGKTSGYLETLLEMRRDGDQGSTIDVTPT